MRVAFAGTFAVRLADRVRARLEVPCEIILGDEAQVAPQLGDVDVLVTLAFTPEMGAAARRLRLVQVPGSGLNRIDRAALPTGAWLANAHGHDTGIAEFVVGVMLASGWGFGGLDAALRAGGWISPWAADAEPPAAWPELSGKTLGILGYGRIGRRVARLAGAFDMTIRAIRRHPTEADARGPVSLAGIESLDDVLKQADYVVITLPLTPETRGLLGARELALMKPTALLVNVARAEIVDEDALYGALARKTIGGAALDVWYRYPEGPEPLRPSRHPFHELSNVLMTPHVAGWTEGTLDARARLIAENIGRVARNERPVNLVSPPAAP